MPDGKLVMIDAEHWQAYPIDVTAGKLGFRAGASANARADGRSITGISSPVIG